MQVNLWERSPQVLRILNQICDNFRSLWLMIACTGKYEFEKKLASAYSLS